MVGFVEAVGNAARNGLCGLLANPLIDGRQWGGPPPFRGEGVANNPLTRRWYNNAIDGLNRIFCDRPAPQPDNFPEPFQGGQCPLPYVITVERTSDVSQPASSFHRVLGPIGGVRFIDVSPTTGRLQILSSAVGLQTNVCGAVGPAGPIEWRDAGVGGSNFVSDNNPTATITNIQPCGHADDCGNPPPIPYNPAPVFNFNTNIDYTDNSGQTFNELGDFNLLAPIFLPGSVQIPFTVNVGGVDLNGNINVDGSIDISPSVEVNVGGDGNPAPIDQPVIPDDPDYPEDEPEEQQESQIVGAWVIVTKDSPRATVIADGPFPQFFPRQGVLKFRIALGGTFTHGPPIDIQTRRAYVPVPRSGRVVGADFFPYYGSEASVTLAYATVPFGLLPAPT